MKVFKLIYGALAIICAAVLATSFFIADVQPINQITLLIQSVLFGFASGMYTGATF